MHSHHSHSGEYVAHGSDTLDGVTGRAIEMGFDVFCMTEHMPRLKEEFIYPEEKEKHYDVGQLQAIFDDYYNHARRIQADSWAKGCHTKFLVGLEVEGIDIDHIEYTSTIRQKYGIDMVVGSVHFVRGIPIDFDKAQFARVLELCGSFRQLALEYFQLQYKVIDRLHPEVIGHFDLIRLFMDGAEIDESTGKKLSDVSIETDWPDVWNQIKINLQLANSYGGLIELNSSAIRKGWNTPYPQFDVAKAVKLYNDGRFCLSDDSHSIAQVGLNYHKVLDYVVNELKLDKLYYLDVDLTSDSRKVTVKTIDMEDVKKNKFWEQFKD